MLVCDRADLAQRARFLATQARDPAPHYQHSEIGYNYRMSDLLAAVGRGQLRVLEDRVDQRRANYEFYRETRGDLPGIDFMPEHPRGRSTRWLTCATVDPDAFGATRDDIRLAMEAQNVESRPAWKPMHLQPVFASCRVRGGGVAEEVFQQGLCLPSGSNLSDDDRLRVADIVPPSRRPPHSDASHPPAEKQGGVGSLSSVYEALQTNRALLPRRINGSNVARISPANMANAPQRP